VLLNETNFVSQTETSLRFIDHGAHRVAVLSGNPRASGTPLVFLHGFTGSVHFWPAWLPPSIRDHRRWHSIGLPGHWPGGFSSRGSAQGDGSDINITAESFAEILAAVIRKLSPTQPVALIGHSTGGFAALNLAARAPELVVNVVSVSGFAVGKWHGLLGRLQMLASRGWAGQRASAMLWSLTTFNPAVFRRLLRINAAKLELNSPVRESLLDLGARDAGRHDPAILAKLMANIRRFDIRPLLDGICAPTLIAGGDRDPIIRYEHTCELASEIRGAELVTFRDVGHLFFVECSDLFQHVLEDWIDRHCDPCEWKRTA
jgi:pimeloyl-ACP methyl ester carboxylesterase